MSALFNLILGNNIVQYALIALLVFGAYKSHIYFERRDAVQQEREIAAKKGREQNAKIDRDADKINTEERSEDEKDQKETENELGKMAGIRRDKCVFVTDNLDAIGLQHLVKR